MNNYSYKNFRTGKMEIKRIKHCEKRIKQRNSMNQVYVIQKYVFYSNSYMFCTI